MLGLDSFIHIWLENICGAAKQLLAILKSSQKRSNITIFQFSNQVAMGRPFVSLLLPIIRTFRCASVFQFIFHPSCSLSTFDIRVYMCKCSTTLLSSSNCTHSTNQTANNQLVVAHCHYYIEQKQKEKPMRIFYTNSSGSSTTAAADSHSNKNDLPVRRQSSILFLIQDLELNWGFFHRLW